MAMTALQMINQAQMELGLPQSSAVYGSTDLTALQMGALANRALDELRRSNRWTALQFEFDLVVNVPTITTGSMQPNSAVIFNIPSTTGLSANNFTVGGAGIPIAARILSVDSPTQVTMTMENSNTELVTNTQINFAQDTYPIPAGFDWTNNRTMWDRTNRWELLGPDSPQMDQWHRSGIVVTGPRRHFRFLEGMFRIWPPPAEISEPIQLVYEFLSINAVQTAGSNPATYTQYFINDGDTTLLDTQAVIMGIKWMFWEIKGFGSYATLQQRWVDYVDRLIARDGAAPTLSLVKRVNPIFLSPANVQDGFFPGPVGPNSS